MGENYFQWQETLSCERICLAAALNLLMWKEVPTYDNIYISMAGNFILVNFLWRQIDSCRMKFDKVPRHCQRYFRKYNATNRVILPQNFTWLFNPSLEESSNLPGKYPTLAQAGNFFEIEQSLALLGFSPTPSTPIQPPQSSYCYNSCREKRENQYQLKWFWHQSNFTLQLH